MKITRYNILIILIFEVFFLYFFIEKLGLNRSYEFMIDLSILIYFMISLKYKKYNLKKEDRFLLAFLILGFLSWLLYERNIFSLLLTLRSFILPMLIYFGTKISNFSEYKKYMIIKIMLSLMLLQSLFVIIELFYGIPWGDAISGSLGRGKNQVLFSISVILLSYYTSKYKRNKINFTRFVFIISIISIPPLVASTMFYIIFVPFYLIIASYLNSRKKFVTSVSIIFIVILYIYSLPYIARLHDRYRKRGHAQELLADKDRIMNYGRYGTKSEAMGRIQTLYFIIDDITNNFDIPVLIGHGIGSTKQSAIYAWCGKLEKEHINQKIARNAISYFYWEYGLFGIFFISFFFYYHIKKAKVNNEIIIYLLLGIILTSFYLKWFQSIQSMIFIYIMLGFNKNEKKIPIV